MTWLEALFLGVLQGITEFFPVSSSGHLVLGQEVLGIEAPGIVFDVFVHVATLISVLIVYRATLWRLIQGMFLKGEESSWSYILKLGLASIPAAIAGFTLQDFFVARFDDASFAATMLLVTGALVWSTRWGLGLKRVSLMELLPIPVSAIFAIISGSIAPFLIVLLLVAAIMALARSTAPAEKTLKEPTWSGAAIMGVAQAIAILPGISRSGSTVVTGIWRRIDPVAAAEFSFLMSIPAILGAAVLQLPEAMSAELSLTPAALIAGFLAAAISGVLAIRFFVALLRKQNFHVFAYYCWTAGALFLLFYG